MLQSAEMHSTVSDHYLDRRFYSVLRIHTCTDAICMFCIVGLRVLLHLFIMFLVWSIFSQVLCFIGVPLSLSTYTIFNFYSKGQIRLYWYQNISSFVYATHAVCSRWLCECAVCARKRIQWDSSICKDRCWYIGFDANGCVFWDLSSFARQGTLLNIIECVQCVSV